MLASTMVFLVAIYLSIHPCPPSCHHPVLFLVTPLMVVLMEAHYIFDYHIHPLIDALVVPSKGSQTLSLPSFPNFHHPILLLVVCLQVVQPVDHDHNCYFQF